MDRKRILQVREVRTAIATIVVREVAARLARDREPLRRLDAIIEKMRERASLKDWNHLNKLDLAFHRELCGVSGNRMAITPWEAVAESLL